MPPDRLPNQARRQHATTSPTLAARASPTPASLPPQLSGVAPECAKQCLLTYIDQEYSCPQNGFDCLCQDYSSKGFTLGELGYICVHQHCGDHQDKARVLYNICRAQADAASPTLTVLVPPATTGSGAPATTTEKTNTTSSSRSSTTTAALTTPDSQTASNTQSHYSTTTASSSATSPSSTTASSTGPAPMAASMSASMHSTSKLSGGAIAGIAIGIVAAVALITAALLLLFCFRRRRNKEKDQIEKTSFDFIDKGPTPFTPARQTFQNPPRPAPRRPSIDMRRTDRDTAACWQLLATQSNQRVEQEVHESPESVESNGSARSLSRLLRDRREAAAAPRVSQAPSSSMSTTTTVVNREPAQPAPKFDGFGLPSNPRAKQSSPNIHLSESQQSSPAVVPKKMSLPTIRPPSLCLDIPTSATRTPGIPASSSVGYPQSPMKSPQGAAAPLPMPYPRSPLRSPLALASPMGFPSLPVVAEEEPHLTEPPLRTPLRSQSRDSSTSLLNYYASPEAGTSVSSPIFSDSPTPIDPAKQTRRPAPSSLNITRTPGTPQAVRRDSGGSDTSFESADPDEPTPPEEEERQLTPVQESPMRETSPITDLRYPKIPRSANQTIPRSPPQPSPSQMEGRLPAAIKPPKPTLQIYKAYSPKPVQQQEDEEDWPLKSPITPNRPILKNSSTLSGSTLAVKRRGSNGDLRLEIPETTYPPFVKVPSPLRIGEGGAQGRGSAYKPPSTITTNAAGRHDSPLKNYGRGPNGSGGQKATSRRPSKQKAKTTRPRVRQASEPQTPDWEPRLTPKRKGDELYLQVGVATPMKATF